MASKWLELLTEIAPGTKRTVMMFNPDTAPYTTSYVLPSFEAAARSRKIDSIVAPVHSDVEIEAVITALGRDEGDSLLGLPDNFVEIHRANHIARSRKERTCDLPDACYRSGWRSAFLRSGLPRYFSPLCPVRG